MILKGQFTMFEVVKLPLLFMIGIKKSLSLLQGRGLQLPRSLPQDGFVHSICENGININIKIKNVTERK